MKIENFEKSVFYSLKFHSEKSTKKHKVWVGIQPILIGKNS